MLTYSIIKLCLVCDQKVTSTIKNIDPLQVVVAQPLDTGRVCVLLKDSVVHVYDYREQTLNLKLSLKSQVPNIGLIEYHKESNLILLAAPDSGLLEIWSLNNGPHLYATLNGPVDITNIHLFEADDMVQEAQQGNTKNSVPSQINAPSLGRLSGSDSD